MTSKKPKKVTAAEFMAELMAKDEFVREDARRAAMFEARAEELRSAEVPIVNDLRSAGVEVSSVWDLVNSPNDYDDALPILVQHLSTRAYPDRVRESLGRALAVRQAQPYWGKLRDLYLAATGAGEGEGLAIALAGSAAPENLDGLLELINQHPQGTTQIHLLRAIKRVGGRRGIEFLESLSSDPVFGKEATALLRARR